MTDDRIALETLIGKASDADFLRQMIGFAAERLMALEVDALCGAGHGERSAERTNHRNGYRERTWETRAGAVTLPIPKLRRGCGSAYSIDPFRHSCDSSVITKHSENQHIESNDLLPIGGHSAMPKQTRSKASGSWRLPLLGQHSRTGVLLTSGKREKRERRPVEIVKARLGLSG